MFRSVLRRAFVAVLPIVAVGAASRIAPAQCLDWAEGFGVPGNGVNGSVTDLQVWDDGLGGGPALYAAGDFWQAGGVPVYYAAKWNGSAWQSLGGGFDTWVRELGVHDDGTGSALYAAGGFTLAGGVPATGVAKWDGASWAAVGSGIVGAVQDLVSFDDGSGPALFAAGSFNSAGGVTVSNVAKWDGTAWSDVGGGTNGQVLDLEVFDDGGGPALFACGAFTLAGGNGVLWIAKWDGTAWSALPVGPSGSGGLEQMTVYDDGGGAELYVGGSFNFLNGAPWKALARWNGSVWNKVGTASLSSVGSLRVLCVHDDGGGPALFVAGSFTSIGGVAANYVARWDGGAWSALTTGLTPSPGDPWVYAMASASVGGASRLWVGGDIDVAGGKPSSGIARYGETCTPPLITAQPTDQSASYPEAVYFEVSATGLAPMTYQWRHGGVPVVNGGAISGADTAKLRIGQWTFDDRGDYDVVIVNPLGTVTSAIATLTVPVPSDSGAPVAADVILSPPAPVNGLPPGNNYTWISGINCGDDDFAALTTLINGGTEELSTFGSGTLLHHHAYPEAAPGLPAGITFASSGSTRTFEAAPGGCLVFDAQVAGPGVDFTNNVGVWFQDGSGIDLVARNGNQAAGFPAGQVWRDIQSPRTNAGDRVAFQANVFSGGSLAGSGVWQWSRIGGAQLLAAANTPAFGAPGSTWKSFSIFVDVNALGEAQFFGRLDTITGFNYSGAKDTGLWAGVPGNLRLQVRSGDPAPGMPAGSNIEQILEDRVLFTDAGEAVFEARVAGPGGFYKNALYRAHGGVLTPLVLYGDPAPGGDPSAVFFDPAPWDTTASGTTLVRAGLQTSCPNPCPSYGVFVRTATTVYPVVQDRQDPLPGAPANYTLQAIRNASINASEQVVVTCELNNGGLALYGWTAATGLFPIAVPGGQLEFAAGDYRTIANAFIGDELGNTSGLGASNELLDSGLFRFRVAFWDGSSAMLEGRFQEFIGAEFGPGKAYCFGDGTGKPCPCGNLGGAGEGCANSKGWGAVLDAHGSVGISDDSLLFDVAGLPSTKPTLLFQAPNLAGGGTGVAFGDGLLCVGGSIKRLSVKMSSASGAVSFGPGLGVPGQWLAGQTRRFQAWYRDPNGPCASATNLSNGYEVTFVP